MQKIKLTSLLRSVVPWLLAIVLIFWLFQRHPIEQVLEAARHANWLALVGFILIYFFLFSLADIWSLQKILADFGTNGRLKRVAQLRLASNLAMILNYGLGQGVLAYLIKKSFDDSILRVSSVLALILLSDFYLAVSISCLGTLLTPVVVGGYDLAPWIRISWGGLTLSLLILIGIWRTKHGGEWFLRFRSARIFHVLNIAQPLDYLKVLLRRLPFVLIATSFLYFLAQCFNVHIPLAKVLALFPISMVVGAIPITPSGLGTEQVAAIFLFQGFITGAVISAGTIMPAEMILAMSLLFTASIYLLKLISGVMFMPRVLFKKGATL